MAKAEKKYYDSLCTMLTFDRSYVKSKMYEYACTYMSITERPFKTSFLIYFYFTFANDRGYNIKPKSSKDSGSQYYSSIVGQLSNLFKELVSEGKIRYTSHKPFLVPEVLLKSLKDY